MTTMEFTFRLAHSLAQAGLNVFIRPSAKSESFYLYIRRSRKEHRKGCFKVRVSNHKPSKKAPRCDAYIYPKKAKRGVEGVVGDVLKAFELAS